MANVLFCNSVEPFIHLYSDFAIPFVFYANILLSHKFAFPLQAFVETIHCGDVFCWSFRLIFVTAAPAFADFKRPKRSFHYLMQRKHDATCWHLQETEIWGLFGHSSACNYRLQLCEIQMVFAWVLCTQCDNDGSFARILNKWLTFPSKNGIQLFNGNHIFQTQ